MTRTTLTAEEHQCAEFMAYFRAMERGGHKVPPYNHTAAIRDFTIAAGTILKLANHYPSAEVDALYEQHPLDDRYDRPVPVALRKRPYLLFTQVALLCFDKIRPSLTPTEYWTLLGHIWTANTKDKTHYHPSYTSVYRNLFTQDIDQQHTMMTSDEQSAYSRLRKSLTVYRGCGEDNKQGLSWSLSEKTARGFARDWNNPPWWILKGTCAPTDVLAYFNRDNEREVIILGEVTTDSETPYFE